MADATTAMKYRAMALIVRRRRRLPPAMSKTSDGGRGGLPVRRPGSGEKRVARGNSGPRAAPLADVSHGREAAGNKQPLPPDSCDETGPQPGHQGRPRVP